MQKVTSDFNRHRLFAQILDSQNFKEKYESRNILDFVIFFRKMDSFLKFLNFFCCLFQFFNILNVLYYFEIFDFFIFLEVLLFFFENFKFLINN
jgi:hypothetical protein